MSEPEWISRCADQLQKQWPLAGREDLEHTARYLMEQAHWRCEKAEDAAVMWLRLGVTTQ